MLPHWHPKCGENGVREACLATFFTWKLELMALLQLWLFIACYETSGQLKLPGRWQKQRVKHALVHSVLFICQSTMISTFLCLLLSAWRAVGNYPQCFHGQSPWASGPGLRIVLSFWVMNHFAQVTSLLTLWLCFSKRQSSNLPFLFFSNELMH